MGGVSNFKNDTWTTERNRPRSPTHLHLYPSNSILAVHHHQDWNYDQLDVTKDGEKKVEILEENTGIVINDLDHYNVYLAEYSSSLWPKRAICTVSDVEVKDDLQPFPKETYGCYKVCKEAQCKFLVIREERVIVTVPGFEAEF